MSEEVSLLDALHAELRDYEARRAAFLGKQGVDPEYRAAILKMWDAAMAAQQKRIERETNGAQTNQNLSRD